MPDKEEEMYSEMDGSDRQAAVPGEHIDRHLALHIEREVARQVESLSLTGKARAEVRELQQRLKLHHKIAYGSMVFLGVLLMWYGAWTAIATVPILKNPAVALVTGMVLLGLTGVLYNKMTS